MPPESLSLTPIGHIRTPFKDRAEAPRQPGADGAGAQGEIVLLPGMNFEQALEDLDGFEFIWMIAWFHENKNWKPKVLPPRGSAIKRGVFATRSPHRPNPIGLSLARLVGVSGLVVRVAETDLLDGTPILDLKPYLPFAEAQPDARAGWLDAAENSGSAMQVTWSALAAEQATWLKSECQIDLATQAERVLRQDCAPHPYRRISTIAAGGLQLAIKSWRVEFAVAGERVDILRIASGYSRAALNADDATLHEAAAHRAFHARWPQG